MAKNKSSLKTQPINSSIPYDKLILKLITSHKNKVLSHRQICGMLTIKDPNLRKLIFEKLIERNLELDCNHHFIEGFYKVPGKNYYEFVLGS